MAVSKKQQKISKPTESKSGFAFLLILFAGLPLLMSTTLLDYTLLPRQMFLALWSIVTILFFRKKLNTSAGVNAIIIAFAVLILLHFVPLLLGVVNTIESLAVLSKYLGFLAFAWVFYVLYKSSVFTKETVLKAFLIYAAISSVVPLFQILASIFSGDFVEDIYTIKGTFSHKNLLSISLFLGLPFLIAGRVYLSKNLSLLATVLLVLSVIEIFVLRTRGVWLATAIGGGVFLLISLSQKGKVNLNKKLFFGLTGAAILLLAGLFAVPQIREGVLNTANVNNRFIFWQHSLSMISDHPAGVGAGNWKLHFPKYGLESFVDDVAQGVTHIQRPHNDYLWLASEGTVLAAIFYLAMFVFSIVKAWGNIKSGESKDAILNGAVIMGLVGYALFSITDFPLERIETNVLFFILLLLPFYSNKDVVLPKVLSGALIGVFTAFSLFIAYQRFGAEQKQVEVLEYNKQRNAQAIIPAATDALSDYYNIDVYANPVLYYRSQGELAIRNADAALLSAREGLSAAPNNILVLNQIGNCFKMKGQLDSALVYYKEAQHISPRMKETRYSQAEIYLRKKDYNEALIRLYSINPFTTNNPHYVNLLAQTLKGIRQQGSARDFDEFVRFLNNRNPQSAQGYLSVYKDYRSNNFAIKKKP